MSQGLDNIGCINNTIKTYSGKYLDLLNPDPKDIDIESIAAGLAKACRFGGQCPVFYSVAEHCVHAANLAIHDNRPFDAIKAVFLHDAAEAYLGDMVKPLKIALKDYQVVEASMEHAIEVKFGISFDKHHSLIKHYDLIMLKTEKNQMWPDDKEEWTGLDVITESTRGIRCWLPHEAEDRFNGHAAMLGLIGVI